MQPFGVNYFVLAVWGDKSAAAFSLSLFRSLLQLFLWRCAKNCLRAAPAFAYIVFFTLSPCQWIRVGELHESYGHPLSPRVCVDRMLKCGVQPATLRAHQREENVIFPQSSVRTWLYGRLFCAARHCWGFHRVYIRPVTMPLLLGELLLRDCIDTWRNIDWKTHLPLSIFKTLHYYWLCILHNHFVLEVTNYN